MLRAIFLNPLPRAAAILGISSFSIIATAFGFRLILGDGHEYLIWIAAGSVQVILVSSALSAFGASALRFMIISLLIYFSSVTISGSGSFFTFDSWLSSHGRAVVATNDVVNDTSIYVNEASRAIASREATLERENAKIDQLLVDEFEVGIASNDGPGKGPMYRTFLAIKKSLISLYERYDVISAEINAIWEQEGSFNITHGHSSNLHLDDVQNRAEALAEQVSLAISKAPSDDLLRSQIDELYRLIHRTKYGDVYKKPTEFVPYPRYHRADKLISGTREEIVVGAIKDLRNGKITTYIALISAIILDGLIFLIALLDSIFEKQAQRGETTNQIISPESQKNHSSIEDVVRSINKVRSPRTHKALTYME